MELRFQVEEDYIRQLRERLNYKNYTDLARDALTLLDWASRETLEGKVILSGSLKGDKLVRLALPKLEEARSRVTIS